MDNPEDAKTATPDGTVRIGVYTPQLQDQFFGELITQLQQLCRLKSYKISIIKTNGFGEYESTLHVSQLDFCIFLRNAVHPNLVEYIINAGIPCVSVSYDYYPLDVPVISCNNDLGVELAVNHLLKQGHRSLAFVGNIKNYDIRKRYEAFCDQLSINQLEFDEDSIFITDEDFYIGASHAATRYIKGGCKATGILCGSGLTGLGFDQQVSKLMPHKHADIDLVCFDALSVIAVTSPKLSVIEQNLHFVAYRAIQIYEQYKSGAVSERVTFVDPQIRTSHSDYENNEHAYLAAATDVAELMSPTYMKSILDSVYEWPKTIVNNNLDDIAVLSLLFPDHVDKACYARIALSRENKEFAKILKIMNATGARKVPAGDSGSISQIKEYPAKCDGLNYGDADCAIHLPIYRFEKIWAVLTILGSHRSSTKYSSMRGLFAYLEHTVDLFESKLIAQLSTEKQTPKEQTTVKPEITGTIKLANNRRDTEWDDTALIMIGIKSDLERNIYRHFELYDCFDPDDLVVLMEKLDNDAEEDFELDVKIRHKDKRYHPYLLVSSSKQVDAHYIIHISASGDPE